jgi:hypothetical protein
MRHPPTNVSNSIDPMSQSSAETNRVKLNQLFRLALVILFGSCGLWLLPHCLSMLAEAQGTDPWGTAWTWSHQVEVVFYRIASGVWLGIYVSGVSGTLAMVVTDLAASLCYLLAAALLLQKRRSGLSFALGISFVSVTISAVGILQVEARAIRQVGNIVFTWDIVVLIGYAFLTYALAKSWLPNRA